jgi:hypothetical protein
MSIRIQPPSLLRPRESAARTVLKESRALVEGFNRRGVLRGGLTLGALTLLTGCDVSEEESVQNGDQRPWTLQQIYQLPEQELIFRHICVEGWDYIGQWSGPNFRAFLARIGADLTAKYIYFICNDDFTESIDMASALHPQTILATKYAGEPITDPFGYPLRLRTTVKLGYKNPKWIRAIEVTNAFRPTFWSKQGENWFAGI